MTTHYRPDSPNALTDGQWVYTRGIARWVPERAPLAIVDDMFVARTELDECDVCGAQADAPCIKNGRQVRPHPGRIVRYCQCGAVLGPWKKRYCEPCRVKARRRTWNKQAAAKRAARDEEWAS